MSPTGAVFRKGLGICLSFFDIPLMAVTAPPMGGADGVTGASGTPDLPLSFSSASAIRFLSFSWTVFLTFSSIFFCLIKSSGSVIIRNSGLSFVILRDLGLVSLTGAVDILPKFFTPEGVVNYNRQS